MNYFQITVKGEEVNESLYTLQSTGEIITKVQLSLVVPSMRDRVLCELPVEKAPKADILEKWELDESWVDVSAEGMRALAFERRNARAGEKPVGALVVFQAVEARDTCASPKVEAARACRFTLLVPRHGESAEGAIPWRAGLSRGQSAQQDRTIGIDGAEAV
jgi:hypothetical protein